MLGLWREEYSLASLTPTGETQLFVLIALDDTLVNATFSLDGLLNFDVGRSDSRSSLIWLSWAVIDILMT